MTLENIIHEYVSDLAEEAVAQIQTNVEDIETFEYPCTEDHYVKLAIDATLMKDPIEALNAVLGTHAWVMTRESIKKEGCRIIDVLLKDGESEELLSYMENVWDEAMGYTKETQNKKLVEMIIGDSNGN